MLFKSIMRSIIRLFLFVLIIFSCCFTQVAVSAVDEQVYSAKVLDVGEVVEQDGLRMQTIRCEILKGEFKGSVREVQVPLEESFLRPVKEGDRVKLSFVSIGEEQYFQFYDFARSRNYVWLFILFIVIVIVLVGWKGIKTLLPSLILIFLLLIGAIPSLLPKVGLLVGSLLLIGLIGAVTTWIRIKHKLLTVIVPFSVISCLLIAFLVFFGFSQTAYIVPFIGSITTLDEGLYLRVVDLVLVSIIFIPAGGVINASIQVAKYLVEEFGNVSDLSIAIMLKEGMRISQKISAGELNNLIVIMIGVSLAGIYLIEEQYSHLSHWDNGWVSLQVIYTVAAGLSILLITPITVLVSAAIISLSRGKTKVKGHQRRFKFAKKGSNTK